MKLVWIRIWNFCEFPFSEKREKFNITEKDGLLTYLEEVSYYYEPTEKETSLDAVIVTVNPLYFVRYWCDYIIYYLFTNTFYIRRR